VLAGGIAGRSGHFPEHRVKFPEAPPKS